MAKILVLHGPNLNLLGLREPEIYGTTTLKEVDEQIKLFAETAGHELVTFQSNAEHELIDQIQLAKAKTLILSLSILVRLRILVLQYVMLF